MTFVKSKKLFCLIISLSLVCCSKNNPQAPDPVDPVHSLHINISMLLKQADLAIDPVHKYELIISENSGKVILDTLVSYYTPVIADLRISQSLVDVTTIRFRSQDSVYFANVYRAVDPSAWHNFPESDSVALPPSSAAVNGKMTIINAHANEYDWYGLSVNNSSLIAEWAPEHPIPSFDIRYYPNPVNYSYLVFPLQRLYKVQTTRSAIDTIDFSKPDTAVALTFKKPALLDQANFFLYGYPDTTDPAKLVDMGYHFLSYYVNVGADLVYPGKKGFKKYSLDFSVSDATGKYTSTCYLPFTDTIPADLPFPDPAWYTISPIQNNTVSVDFGAHKPTCYTISGTIGDVGFNVTAPPDSNVQHPLTFGPPLKSLLLKDHDLSLLKVSGLYMYFDNASGYQNYFQKKTDVKQPNKKPDNTRISSYQYYYQP